MFILSILYIDRLKGSDNVLIKLSIRPAGRHLDVSMSWSSRVITVTSGTFAPVSLSDDAIIDSLKTRLEALPIMHWVRSTWYQ